MYELFQWCVAQSILTVLLGFARRNIFIALVFHQWLEGIGLGAMISIANFKMWKCESASQILGFTDQAIRSLTSGDAGLHSLPTTLLFFLFFFVTVALGLARIFKASCLDRLLPYCLLLQRGP